VVVLSTYRYALYSNNSALFFIHLVQVMNTKDNTSGVQSVAEKVKPQAK
jgi:hypothetical protein